MEPTPLSWKHGAIGVGCLLLVAIGFGEFEKHKVRERMEHQARLLAEFDRHVPDDWEEQLSEDLREAWWMLAKTDYFQSGWGCYQEKIPVQFLAWGKLLESPDPEPLFALLCSEGTAAGRAHGLAGLAAVDSPLYPAALREAKLDERQFHHHAGWTGTRTTLAEALESGPIEGIILLGGRFGSEWEADFHEMVVANLEAERQKPEVIFEF